MEIGSDFWGIDEKEGDIRFFLSGRTALDFIIRDILLCYPADRVLMPSYCCHTMLEPFLRNHVPVLFYDVFFDGQGLKADIPNAAGNSILFRMDYFGYGALSGWGKEDIDKNYLCVVEDCTHSCARRGNAGSMADYTFASYRKWTGFDGFAVAEKRKGRFQLLPKSVVGEGYIQLHRSAKNRKKEYLAGRNTDKKEYLDIYKEAEEYLETDYVDYVPSIETIERFFNWDIQKMAATRRNNAAYLIEQIKKVPEVTLLYSKMTGQDTPLHVPVLLPIEIRDKLRKHLISEDIYCPVHWPLSGLHGKISGRAKEIYNRELSLICDQRYSVDDMQREADAIMEFFRTKKI